MISYSYKDYKLGRAPNPYIITPWIKSNTTPREFYVNKVGKKWLEVNVRLQEGHVMEGKIEIGQFTSELKEGTFFNACTWFKGEKMGDWIFSLSKVPEITGQKEFVKTDADIVVENFKKLKRSFCSHFNFETKTMTIRVIDKKMNELIEQRLTATVHPSKLVETVEIKGQSITVLEIPTLKKFEYFAEVEGNLVAGYAFEKAGAKPVSKKKARFLAEAQAQIWDGCPHCNKEPVYAPKFVCENCW